MGLEFTAPALSRLQEQTDLRLVMMVAMLAIFAVLTCWVLSGSDEYAYGSVSYGRVCHLDVFIIISGNWPGEALMM